MPTPTKGPRLGGGPAHERLLLANLATQLFAHRRITTTEAKAKRVRPLAERRFRRNIVELIKRVLKIHPERAVEAVTNSREEVPARVVAAAKTTYGGR